MQRGKRQVLFRKKKKKAGDEIRDEVQAEETAQEANAKAAAEAAAALEEEEARDAQEAADGGAASAEGAGGEKSQIDELEEEISKRDETIALMHDKLQRQMAEFDNFRKRTEKEKADMFGMGASDILKKILPVVDNFERGFNTIPDGEEKTQFAVGMDMVYKQLLKMLEDNKVTPIEAVGKEFDPQFHNAVQHVEKDDVGENIVVEEFEKGYMYGDTVLRHSMVIVAN
jgi:molecular chaperone GrpE